ncbi:MAG: FG-GAP-like repeat-containing protein [Muribaculaceae bacterium]|nr:FG-GAP-like repeat-containing protein [Muribaculaceae bacterium]
MNFFRTQLLCGALMAGTAILPALTAEARDYANWMAELPDEAYVCTLSIPGTHDSATGHGFLSNGFATANISLQTSQTQDKTLKEQMDMGVRAFDFRPGVDGKRLRCWHGQSKINLYYDDAIKEICSWLKDHPDEFFVIHLYKSTDDYNKGVGDLHNDLINDPEVAPHIANFQPNLKVSDMRGKILFLKRYEVEWDSDKIAYMYDWNETEWKSREMYLKSGWHADYESRKARIVMQDKAEGAANDKVARFKELYQFTSSYAPVNDRDMLWTLNFASSYDKSKKVSGIVGQFADSSSDSYAENASVMLPEILNMLKTAVGPMGIVLMDWVGDNTHLNKYNTQGETVVHAIADNNFRYLPNIHYSQAEIPVYEDINLDNVFPGHSSTFRGTVDWIDLNSDGQLDLVMKGREIADGWAPKSRVSYAEGSSLAPCVELPSSAWQAQIIPIDYNADGHIDFINACAGGSVLYRNERNGNFSQVSNFSLEGKEIDLDDGKADIERRGTTGLMVCADLDLDGYPEIITYGRGSTGCDGTPIIFRNMSATTEGSFSLSGCNIPALKNGTMAVGDYNRDGAPDILISGMTAAGSRQVSICINNGMTGSDFNFEVMTPEDLQPFATDYGIVGLVDFNNDGLLDIFISGRLSEESVDITENDKTTTHKNLRAHAANIFLRNEDGSFFKTYASSVPFCGGDMDWCDMNGDGFVDIVYGGTTCFFNGINGGQDHQISISGILINNGDGTFCSDPTQFEDLRGGVCVSAADFDGDGKPELAMMGYGSNCFHAYKQTQKTRSGGVMPLDAPAMSLEETVDGKTHLSWNAADDGTRYNYVVTTNDGHVYSAVPVDPATGKMRIANMSAAPTGSGVTLNIKKYDIAKVGVQAVSVSKQTSPLEMVAADDVQSGVEVEMINDNTPAEYYNLQGQRVQNPSNGIFIERRGSKTSKRYIR